jgi:hypothetical protein
MAKGIKRLVRKVLKNVNAEIRAETNPASIYSRGLSREGYNGGYVNALEDVLLALNGVNPNRRGWWPEDI